EGLTAYAAQHDRWQTVAQYQKLVKDVLVAHADENGHLHLHQLKTDIKEFVPSDWPSELSALRVELEQHLTSEHRSSIRDLMSRRLRQINDETMAFIYPIFTPTTAGQRGQIAMSPPPGFVIVAINLTEIQQEILPTLAKRHFSGVAGANGFDYSATV